MRKPGIRNLKIDTAATRKIRSEMTSQRTVKITINVDANSLVKLKELSVESGVPYQRLLNNILRDRLAKTNTIQSRLDRIEKELARVKRRLAA